MRQFEVDYETTVPPWHTGHEQIEAEDLDTVREKFCSKHEAKYYMISQAQQFLVKVYTDERSSFTISRCGAPNTRKREHHV